MKAVLCPVCSGTGKVQDYHDIRAYITCHGCGGRGWVEVSNGPPMFWPQYDTGDDLNQPQAT